MTAADELERMAAELDVRAADSRAEADKPNTASEDDYWNAGEAFAFQHAADRLRRRAEELRGPTPVPDFALPKPERVVAGQWWNHVSSGDVRWRPFRILDEEAAESCQDLLADPEAIYLGNGPDPAP